MFRTVVAVVAVLSALTAPAWGQANLTPDPVPRLPAQPGQSPPAEDVEFLRTASAMSKVEIRLGEVAQKASIIEVQQVGRRIADHHRAIGTAVADLAQERRVDLSQADLAVPSQGGPGGAASAVTSPRHAAGAQAQQVEKRLSELRGEDLSWGYVREQIQLHDRLVDLYQTQASNTADAPLASFAIKTLVTIQRDRDELHHIARQLGVAVDRRGQPRQYGDPEQARSR